MKTLSILRKKCAGNFNEKDILFQEADDFEENVVSEGNHHFIIKFASFKEQYQVLADTKLVHTPLPPLPSTKNIK